MFNVYVDSREWIEQEQKDDPTYHNGFTAMVESMRNIELQEGGESDRPSRDEIEDFWQDESKLIRGIPSATRRRRKKGE